MSGLDMQLARFACSLANIWSAHVIQRAMVQVGPKSFLHKQIHRLS